MKRLFWGLLSTSILFSHSQAAQNKKHISVRNNQAVVYLESNSSLFLKQHIQQNLIGEVTGIDLSTGKITLKTQDGASVTISVNDKTSFRRIQPGQTSLANAEQIMISEIKAGDRILVPGGSTNEQTPVRQVVIMAREAIKTQRDQEAEARRARTIVGRITAINPQTKEITIQARGRGNNESLIVNPTTNVKFLRFASDSLKVIDAVAGTFSDLRVGDQVRILGDRSADKASVAAEEILSGSITRTVGSIVDINTAANEVIVKDSRTGQTLTFSLGKNTTLRQISPEAAESLKQRFNQREERRREGNRQQTANNSSAQENQERQKRRENRRRNRNANGQNNRGARQPFENLPTITIAQLKKGDAVLITGTGEAAHNSRLTAVSIITGDSDLQQILQRTQGGGRNNNSPRSPGLPGNVSGGNSVNDNDEPRNQK